MAFASLLSEKAKKGDKWQYKIYFDDNEVLSHDNIEKEELMDTFKELVGGDEDIKNVWAYKVPLFEKQPTQHVLYHMFIVFQTEEWFWSIEKYSDGITIKRSKTLKAVKERYKQSKRNSGISLMQQDEGIMSVYKLIDWLYENDELNKSYNYISSNCQHFARAVFNQVSKTKKL